METFSTLLSICAGNSPVTGEFPAQKPVTRSFDAFFDLRLNKRLSKQSWGWWFESPSRPLWRHCNGAQISCVTLVPSPVNHTLYPFSWFPNFVLISMCVQTSLLTLAEIRLTMQSMATCLHFMLYQLFIPNKAFYLKPYDCSSAILLCRQPH